MTMTEATGRSWIRGRQLALALFAASVALAGGAQALAPAPAAAMISEGEECDSSYPSIDCETTGGGGGGESGGGTSNPEGGGGDTVGPGEVIEVEGKAPDETPPASPCGKNCLPSQLGGRHGPGGDGIGQKTPGRHGGRPTKVAKAPKKDAESGDPSLEDCRALMAGALALSIDSRIQAQSAAATALDERARNLTVQRGLLEIEASGLAVGTVGLEALRQTMRSVDQQIYEIRMQSFHMGQTLQYLRSERDREKRNLRWECLGRYGAKALAAG